MRRQLAAAGVAIAALLVASAPAQAGSVWHTIAAKKGSGAFSVKSFARTVNDPGALRLVARSTNGAAVSWSIACSRNFAIQAHGGNWTTGPGKHVRRLPVMW